MSLIMKMRALTPVIVLLSSRTGNRTLKTNNSMGIIIKSVDTDVFKNTVDDITKATYNRLLIRQI
ncbi:MAG: hypothetical protein J6568_07880 [Snodgrassella sp.]|nr:hypothetical protein [Snodgrassella sp.]